MLALCHQHLVVEEKGNFQSDTKLRFLKFPWLGRERKAL